MDIYDILLASPVGHYEMNQPPKFQMFLLSFHLHWEACFIRFKGLLACEISLSLPSAGLFVYLLFCICENKSLPF